MKNETSRRLTNAAGALERALGRFDLRPGEDEAIAVHKAGDALADALDDVAGSMDDGIAAGCIMRVTDAYGEKSFAYLTTKAYQAKGLRTVTNVDSEGRFTFNADTAKADAFRDAASDMIVVARTIADRLNHGGR